MDRITKAQFEQEVDQVMRERGIDRAEAFVLVGLKHGELYGDGDILFVRPLTPEQRRRLGLGRSLRQVMVDLGELDDDQTEESDVAPAAPQPRRAIGT